MHAERVHVCRSAREAAAESDAAGSREDTERTRCGLPRLLRGGCFEGVDARRRVGILLQLRLLRVQ